MNVKRMLVLTVVVALLPALIACETGRGTGALAGGGVGAIVGGAAGGWQWAAVGAAAGAAGGYIIGNEVDEANKRQAQYVPRDELTPLAGTSWRLVSAEGEYTGKGYIGSVYRFGTDGRITAHDPGSNSPRPVAEWFRVVGDVLIVYSDDYVYNFSWSQQGSVLNVRGKGEDQRYMNLSLARES